MKSIEQQQRMAVLRISVFGIVFLASVVLSFYGLMLNSQGAKERYDRLIAVDQSGGDVETALNDLRSYIYSHMNTQIGSDLGVRPPIQLKGTYDRLVAAEEQRVKQINDALYAEAQSYCESTQPQGFLGRTRLPCIEEYIDKNGAKPKVIEDDFYKFDFVPPRWSPDLAGFSILAAITSGIALITQTALYLRIKNLLHH